MHPLPHQFCCLRHTSPHGSHTSLHCRPNPWQPHPTAVPPHGSPTPQQPHPTAALPHGSPTQSQPHPTAALPHGTPTRTHGSPTPSITSRLCILFKTGRRTSSTLLWLHPILSWANLEHCGSGNKSHVIKSTEFTLTQPACSEYMQWKNNLEFAINFITKLEVLRAEILLNRSSANWRYSPEEEATRKYKLLPSGTRKLLSMHNSLSCCLGNPLPHLILILICITHVQRLVAKQKFGCYQQQSPLCL